MMWKIILPTLTLLVIVGLCIWFVDAVGAENKKWSQWQQTLKSRCSPYQVATTFNDGLGDMIVCRSNVAGGYDVKRLEE